MYDIHVSYKTAELAKLKGFDISTLSFYSISGEQLQNERLGKLLSYNSYSGNPIPFGGDQVISAPTLSELAKWLRDEKQIAITALPYREEEFEDNKIMWYYSVVNLNEEGNIFCDEADLGATESDFFDTYEIALEEGLIKGLELINV